ncbi:hypothetical protein ACUH94_03725 [Dermabacteraceae bacterium P7074]
MARRTRTLRQRISDQLFFSAVMVTGIFMLLKLIGMRIGIQGLVLSIILTVAINVGMSYLPARGRSDRGAREQSLIAPEDRADYREGERRG